MKSYQISLLIHEYEFGICHDYCRKEFEVESFHDLRTLADNIQTEIEALATMRSVAIARIEKPKCNCDRRDLMTYGCKCGGV